MHVCMDCFEIYDIKYLHRKSDYTYVDAVCPKKNCHGDVVELDEMIAPAVIELNRKGYFTDFCCSGHWYNEGIHTYLVFEDAECVPDTLPKGFFLETKNDKYAIFPKNNSEIEDECKKHLYIMKLNHNLTEWAFSLPSREERDLNEQESLIDILQFFKYKYESEQGFEFVEIENKPFKLERKMKFRVVNKKDGKSLNLFNLKHVKDKQYPVILEDMDNDYTIHTVKELKEKINQITQHRVSLLKSYHS